jgi:pantoate--beta-alanine ligase
MRLTTTIEEVREYTRHIRAGRKSLGLVPTMGALHEGHLNLVRRARSDCDAVVASIFLNPTQFGPHEDLSRYPRDLQRDAGLLAAHGVDAVFAPRALEMYPDGFESFVDPGPVASLLEGAARPGHFRGVATVVLKLFNVLCPDVAYFGQKDFQQAVIIHRVVRDLNLDLRLVVCPIVRDRDGLAMSSRNGYLRTLDREAALVLHRSLQHAGELYESGETDARRIGHEIQKVCASESRIQLDYAVIVEPVHLQAVDRVTTGSVALVAARVGPTRLIDNLIFGSAGMTDGDRLRTVFAGSTTEGNRAVAITQSGRPHHNRPASFVETTIRT